MAEQWSKFVDWLTTPLGIWAVSAIGAVVVIMIVMIVVSKIAQSRDKHRSQVAPATESEPVPETEPAAEAAATREPEPTEETKTEETTVEPTENELAATTAEDDFVEQADGGEPAYLFAFSETESEETPAAESAETPAETESEEEGFSLSRADGKPAPARRRPFALRLACATDKAKLMYGEIYNKFASYGVHGRVGGNRVNFKSKGTLYGRMTFGGTSVRLHLPLAVADYDAAVYKQEDFSARRGFEAVPFTVKLRTKKTLNAVLALIDKMMTDAGVQPKKRYDTIDVLAEYPDTYTNFEREGYGWLSAPSVTRAEVEQWSESFANRILQTVRTDETPVRYLRATVSLDALAKAFPAGAHIDIAAMREKELVFSNCNHVTVTASDSLDKALFVTANDFEPQAVMMLCIAGGEAVRVVCPDEPQPEEPQREEQA